MNSIYFNPLALKRSDDDYSGQGQGSGTEQEALEFAHKIFDPIDPQMVEQQLQADRGRTVDIAEKLLMLAQSTPEASEGPGGDMENFRALILKTEDWLAQLDAWAATQSQNEDNEQDTDADSSASSTLDEAVLANQVVVSDAASSSQVPEAFESGLPQKLNSIVKNLFDQTPLEFEMLNQIKNDPVEAVRVFSLLDRFMSDNGYNTERANDRELILKFMNQQTVSGSTTSWIRQLEDWQDSKNHPDTATVPGKPPCHLQQIILGSGQTYIYIPEYKVTHFSNQPVWVPVQDEDAFSFLLNNGLPLDQAMRYFGLNVYGLPLSVRDPQAEGAASDDALMNKPANNGVQWGGSSSSSSNSGVDQQAGWEYTDEDGNQYTGQVGSNTVMVQTVGGTTYTANVGQDGQVSQFQLIHQGTNTLTHLSSANTNLIATIQQSNNAGQAGLQLFLEANNIELDGQNLNHVYSADGSYTTTFQVVQNGQTTTHTLEFNPDGSLSRASSATSENNLQMDGAVEGVGLTGNQTTSTQVQQNATEKTNSAEVREVLSMSSDQIIGLYVGVQINSNDALRMKTASVIAAMVGGDKNYLASISPEFFNAVVHYVQNNRMDLIAGLLQGVGFTELSLPIHSPGTPVVGSSQLRGAQPGEMTTGVGLDEQGNLIWVTTINETTSTRWNNENLYSNYKKSDGTYSSEFSTVKPLLDLATSNATYINDLVVKGDGGLVASGEFGGVGYSTTTNPGEQALEMAKSIAFLNGLTAGGYGLANPDLVAAAKAFAPSEFEDAQTAGSLGFGAATAPVSLGATVLKQILSSGGLNALATFTTELAAGASFEDALKSAGITAGVTLLAAGSLTFLAKGVSKTFSTNAVNSTENLSGDIGALTGPAKNADGSLASPAVAGDLPVHGSPSGNPLVGANDKFVTPLEQLDSVLSRHISAALDAAEIQPGVVRVYRGSSSIDTNRVMIPQGGGSRQEGVLEALQGLYPDNHPLVVAQQAIVDGEKGRVFVTTDLEVARLYAQNSGGSVYFADVPRNSLVSSFQLPSDGLQRFSSEFSISGELQMTKFELPAGSPAAVRNTSSTSNPSSGQGSAPSTAGNGTIPDNYDFMTGTYNDVVDGASATGRSANGVSPANTNSTSTVVFEDAYQGNLVNNASLDSGGASIEGIKRAQEMSAFRVDAFGNITPLTGVNWADNHVQVSETIVVFDRNGEPYVWSGGGSLEFNARMIAKVESHLSAPPTNASLVQSSNADRLASGNSGGTIVIDDPTSLETVSIDDVLQGLTSNSSQKTPAVQSSAGNVEIPTGTTSQMTLTDEELAQFGFKDVP